MDTKICSMCKIEKPSLDFYARPDRPGHRKSACWVCCQKAMTAYNKTDAGKIASARRGKKWSSKSDSRQKTRVYDAVRRALKTGDVKRELCQICRNPDKKAHAHHEDYSRPLNVVWFCRVHHAARHKQLDVMI